MDQRGGSGGVCILLVLGLAAGMACILPTAALGQSGAERQNRIKPPRSGVKTPFNRHVARFTPLFSIDFEDDAGWILGPLASLTRSPGDVIEGRASLRLAAPGRFTVPAEKLPLQANRTYVVEYDYRLPEGLRPNRSLGEAGGLVLERENAPDVPLGRSPGDLWEASGTIRTGIRLDSPDVRFVFAARQGTMVIDRIRFFRHDVDVDLAKVPFWTSGFPRLGNYSLTNPAEVSVRSGMPKSEVERRLALYDFITGTDIDHTTGASAWVKEIRRLNPGIRLLPYKNSFVAEFSGVPPVVSGSGIQYLFAFGLEDEWFAKSPDGKRLIEPDYPFIVQMNHTRYCPEVNGQTHNGYAIEFLADTVLASGLWDGIHFDQPEWYPNPLLIPRALPADTPFPPMDLNGDGVADSQVDIHDYWQDAFDDFFRAASRRLGSAQLMFGNAGYIPSNPRVLPVLNGYMREVFTPYPILPNGEWDTDEAAGWYRVYQNYSLADTLARSPQMVTLEFVGEKLGTPTGTLTPNGIPDRKNELTSQDFRRARLGLATALLGNGFFEYDLVDNTTAPLWFDEFAVDANGEAVMSASGKGYLGQPLGEARELDHSGRILVWADFDSNPLPSWVQTSPAARISTAKSDVIEGGRSLVVSRGDANPDGLVFATDPRATDFVPGRTYQLLVDYRVLEYSPKRFQGLVSASISPAGSPPASGQTASLFQPDVAGAGQQGTLRTVVKPSQRGYRATAFILDNAKVAFDRIRIVESPGGVFRRDFENGIVLVNPTPEPITVPLAQIAGPLKRSGIRRIRGAQVPRWNNGQAVTGPLDLPPGDAIILLANRVAPAALRAPGDLKIVDAGDRKRLQWTPANEYVAGYLIKYGHDPAALTREAGTGRFASIDLEDFDLQPGWTFFARVAAVDFSGRIGPFSDTVTAFAPGNRPASTPEFSLAPDTPTLSPGGMAIIVGAGLGTETIQAGGQLSTRLGNVEVTVNGVPAALLYVSPRRIEFVVPWEIAGVEAIIQVRHAGISSGDRLVQVEPVHPVIQTDAGSDFAVDGDFSKLAPAAAGATITFAATGLGRVAGPPDNGMLPDADWQSQVLAKVAVTINDAPAEVVSAKLSPNRAGLYLVSIVLPEGAAEGSHPVRLIVDEEISNIARVQVAAGKAE